MIMTITLHDIYEVTNRIEGKLDKIEGRVGVLELWRAKVLGQISVVGAIIIISGNILIDFIRSKLSGKG